MYVGVAILAILVGGVGVFSLSQATMGAGLIALACLLGVLARLVQAAKYQEQVLRGLGVVTEAVDREQAVAEAKAASRS